MMHDAKKLFNQNIIAYASCTLNIYMSSKKKDNILSEIRIIWKKLQQILVKYISYYKSIYKNLIYTIQTTYAVN